MVWCTLLSCVWWALAFTDSHFKMVNLNMQNKQTNKQALVSSCLLNQQPQLWLWQVLATKTCPVCHESVVMVVNWQIYINIVCYGSKSVLYLFIILIGKGSYKC